jgi:hypothetical protein
VRGRFDRATAVGLGVVSVSLALYLVANHAFNAGRGDFFHLADAFLNGRTWLDFRPGNLDTIVVGDRVYVPFAPFPAIAFMPLVAVVGPDTADAWEPLINALLAASAVGMCWWLLGRIGVARLVDRLWLVVLFGFSTQILWVTTRGGVWHTGHLVATLLTLACLIELWGRQRAWLVGLMAGAAFLTRAPLAFAVPLYALMLHPAPEYTAGRAAAGAYLRSAANAIPWGRWVALGIGVLPSVVFFFAYNQLRFGTPLESGYALATVPEFLERRRQLGLFSLAHVPMNLDYFLIHVPRPIGSFPFLRPDGLGMSILLTSPGLFLASRADWRSPRAWHLLAVALVVLAPTLLYYGGGWLQYGYRYFLDSVPFVIALCGLAVVRRGGISTEWRVAIAFGTVVMAFGVYWAYRI